MSLAIVSTRAIVGVSAVPVRVEADLANGLPNFSIVGLPDTAIREARDRVRAAIQNSGFEFPQRRITINLAPADLPKNSGRFDLAIALGILAASEQLPRQTLKGWEFFGELSLTGELLSVKGAFILAASTLIEASESSENRDQARRLLLPEANAEEALLSESTRLGFAKSLSEVVKFLKTGEAIETHTETLSATPEVAIALNAESIDWRDVHGQAQAKRAAEIAAAGGHNLLMLGPPGVGKSMIAARLAALLPALNQKEACEIASIQSLRGALDIQTWKVAPYRSPHHNTPARALIGGGQPIQPGEVSLAHHGVLFMDELPEFSRDTLESLREPMETGEVSIARVRDRITLPARFMLVAAMNPCPCGYFGVRLAKKPCRCSIDRVSRYRSRISGPLMERFDMAVSLEAQPTDSGQSTGDSSAALRHRVRSAHDIQVKRQGVVNARLEGSRLLTDCEISADAQSAVRSAAGKWGWSMRSVHRAIRVARTIADLRQSQTVELTDICEAIELRRAIDLSLAV